MNKKTIRTTDTRHFVVLLYIIGFDATVPYQERYRLSYVYPLLNGCEMIRQNSYAYGLVPGLHLIIYRGNESLVEILDGLKLQFEVSIVACLVARLHMHEYEVVAFERSDCSLCLAFLVGVGQTGCTFHAYDFQTGIVTDATNKVDGGDNRP